MASRSRTSSRIQRDCRGTRKGSEMRAALAMALTLALTAVCGCGWMSPMSPRGGSMFKDEGFRITVPTFDTSIKQGQVQTVTISLHRRASFGQDVRLQVEASQGISVTPTDVLVKANDTPDVQLRIDVPKDAAIGEYAVYVKGTPVTGEATSVEFKVKVIAP